MRRKSEVTTHFHHFKLMAENLLDRKIKIFQSDGGGEFDNFQMRQFFNESGIIFQKSCPETPQQNGVAERKHRHLIELARTMLITANLPAQFWVDAVLTATFIINRLPSPTLHGVSPYEKLFHSAPDLSGMRVFGCACFPNFNATSANKISPRSVQCVFLGYASEYKGYRCLDPISGRVYISRNVRFLENVFPYSKLTGTTLSSSSMLSSTVTLVPTRTTAYSHSQDAAPPTSLSPTVIFSPNQLQLPSTQETQPGYPTPPIFTPDSSLPTTSNSQSTPSFSPSHTPLAEPSPTGRTFSPDSNSHTSNNHTTLVDPSPQTSCSPLSNIPAASHPLADSSSQPASPDSTAPVGNVHPMQTRSKSGIFKPKTIFTLNTVVSTPDPTCFSVANRHLKWRAAMAEEFNALISNHTWDLVPFDAKKNVVGSKWIYKTKYLADGSVERYKARLVAQGFNQQAGIDFTETFSPVVKPTTVRLVLTLAVSFNWPIRQLDVKNAFLHGNLTEEVYMRQPPGFVHPQFPHHLCRLRKAIYGLKQAPRAWFHRFSSFLLSHGFTCSRSDTSLFIFRRNSDIIYLLLYVDDIIVTGNSLNLVNHFLSLLNKCFAMKDLGDLHFFLGIHASRTPSGLFLSQQKYISDLLHRFHLHTLKSVRSPLPSRTKLSLTDGELLADATEYRSMVGALQYLTLTRPDITFAVHLVSQFMHVPRTSHMLAVKRIFRYLQGTSSHGLLLQSSRGSAEIIAYSDADWAGCPDTSRSTSGYAIFLGPNLISWRSKKQPTVARSSTEAEYRAIAYAVQDTLHIRSVLFELGFPVRLPTTLYCDNVSASYLML
ncbi:unnamed protein product [Cuscuta epithymum]|uniref:Integrase catalytic domain-containing protein n=1 Tax=Cuscuta epithymum TaxID=186058 RepID=A0AAV0FS17_9ASTE|nr:unnamed protein product [Cuscuta epithymum]